MTTATKPKERPILFKGEMVRAIQAGRKTQTRRVVTGNNSTVDGHGCAKDRWACLDFNDVIIDHSNTELFGGGSYLKVAMPKDQFGTEVGTRHRVRSRIEVGDRLWVRETWAHVPSTAFVRPDIQQTINPDEPDMAAVYRSGWTRSAPSWKPSIHMPRWASRINREVTDKRVQRVQDISESDAAAEGARKLKSGRGYYTDPDNIGSVHLGHYKVARDWFADLWDSIYAKPSPNYARNEDGTREIISYTSYPWGGESGTFEHKGKPHHVYANPWVWVVEFERGEESKYAS